MSKLGSLLLCLFSLYCYACDEQRGRHHCWLWPQTWLALPCTLRACARHARGCALAQALTRLCAAATVSLYGISKAFSDDDLRREMQALGSGAVVAVTRSLSVPDCRLVEFWDMRAAEQALAALNGAAARPPPIVEVSSRHWAAALRGRPGGGPDLQPPRHLAAAVPSAAAAVGGISYLTRVRASWMHLTLGCQQGPPPPPGRGSQSAHMLHQSGSQTLPQAQAEPSFRPGSWDGAVPPLPGLFPADIERGSAEVRGIASSIW